MRTKILTVTLDDNYEHDADRACDIIKEGEDVHKVMHAFIHRVIDKYTIADEDGDPAVEFGIFDLLGPMFEPNMIFFLAYQGLGRMLKQEIQSNTPPAIRELMRRLVDEQFKGDK